MTDLHLHINAVDTLMFRDGRPFNQSDAGASEAVSVFPPYPPTLVGAVRAALWQGPLKGVWCSQKLGSGTNWQRDVLGPLNFGAPILLKDGKPVFPMPLHILEGKDEDGGKHLTRLQPGPEQNCDLGKVQLPVPTDNSLEGVKLIDDRWVNLAGMEKILNGCVPENGDLIERNKLWRTEPRVGIGIDVDKARKTTRTTTDGNLYMASHVRMADNVSLYVKLGGWNDGFVNALRPMAGEHRMAEITTGETVELPEQPKDLKGNYCAILLSPMVVDAIPKAGDKIDDLPGKLVSACLGKPVVIGGWDSNAKPPGPIPLRNCIPAGSVWFMDGGDGNYPDAIGLATQWGFGQIMIGKF